MEEYKEYKERFEKMSTDELVNVFNIDVGHCGWTRSRSMSVGALHDEFMRRGYYFPSFREKIIELRKLSDSLKRSSESSENQLMEWVPDKGIVLFNLATKQAEYYQHN